jgi:hypothetical protein
MWDQWREPVVVLVTIITFYNKHSNERESEKWRELMKCALDKTIGKGIHLPKVTVHPPQYSNSSESMNECFT